jgi:hypothetical protein
MVDNYYIPQKRTAPVMAPAPKAVNHVALRQAVQEGVRAAIPNINASYGGDVTLYITVHIHLHSAGAPAV